MVEQMRDRNRQITYAEKLVATNTNDLVKMTFLVSALRERKANGDLAKALNYGEKLVKAVEDIFATRIKPARVSPGQWEQQKGRTFASVYLLRGQAHNDLGNLNQAEADLLKSYKYSPLASSVAALAAIAEKRKNTEQAIEYYLQAFIRSIEATEGVDRGEIRRQLGQLYAAKHGSENGWGDKLLKTYDAIAKDNAERLAKIEPPTRTKTLVPFAIQTHQIKRRRRAIGRLQRKSHRHQFLGDVVWAMPHRSDGTRARNGKIQKRQRRRLFSHQYGR